MRLMAVLTVALCAVCPLGSYAQIGNSEAGRQLVLRSCSSCHALESSTTATDAAPPFSDVAKANKERPEWIRFWLMDPHPPMPRIALSRQQIENIIAYLDTIQIAAREEEDAVSAGRAYAEQICSECHAVRKGELLSPHERAPAFVVIANARGMSEMALRVWFQSAHPSMPNLVIRDQLADELIPYIMSLKERR
jgi:mono/diheme cytochrome c family protein